MKNSLFYNQMKDSTEKSAIDALSDSTVAYLIPRSNYNDIAGGVLAVTFEKEGQPDIVYQMDIGRDCVQKQVKRKLGEPFLPFTEIPELAAITGCTPIAVTGSASAVSGSAFQADEWNIRTTYYNATSKVPFRIETDNQ